ncbi:MAG: hypothetical protein LBB75_02255, partial [Oscillospiraceae bacterium]|nr:hypothetical protein [Oscillospiraceae bacterium]
MKHLPKRILSCALALLLCLGLGSVAASAAGAPEVTVTLSYADVYGFKVTPQTQFTIPADLSETYGFEDDFGGTKVSVMDAIVKLHLLLQGNVSGLAAVYWDDPYFSWAVSSFMGDGIGAFMAYVNGVDPGVSVCSVEIADGDTVSFFAMYDTFLYTDYFTWFEVEGQKTNAVTVAEGDNLALTLKATLYGMPMAGYHLEDAEIVQLNIVSNAGGYKTAAFSSATWKATIDDEGNPVTISFASAGTYYVSAESDYDYEPFMAPWLVVTVLTPAQYALWQAKTDAKAALDTYKNAAAYRAAQQADLAAAITAGKAAIDAGTDIAGVNTALANAKVEMDAIKTDAQLTAEETAAALAQAKTDAKAALDTYKDAAVYRAAQQAELAAAITAGKAAIDEA